MQVGGVVRCSRGAGSMRWGGGCTRLLIWEAPRGRGRQRIQQSCDQQAAKGSQNRPPLQSPSHAFSTGCGDTEVEHLQQDRAKSPLGPAFKRSEALLRAELRPPNSHVEAPTPEPWHVTAFGNGTFKEVTKLKRGYGGGGTHIQRDWCPSEKRKRRDERTCTEGRTGTWRGEGCPPAERRGPGSGRPAGTPWPSSLGAARRTRLLFTPPSLGHPITAAKQTST